MGRLRLTCALFVVASVQLACSAPGAPAVVEVGVAAPKKSDGAGAEPLVGYDLRRLRPRAEEPLAAMFDRLRQQAVGEGKRAMVLFSADWCEPCRRLDAELGNLQPRAAIGDVRIFELKEEDWQGATRMDEFNGLRRRWYEKLGSYPVLLLLDAEGAKVEEMKEAIERLEGAGVEATLANWLAGAAAS
ncbi:MAG: hypothetical protein IPK80_13770 [Nannocystis sp.]|nr:hypothetical protein [Nannocystis sp.]